MSQNVSVPKLISNRTLFGVVSECIPLENESVFCTDLYQQGQEIRLPYSFEWKGYRADWKLSSSFLPETPKEPKHILITLRWNTRCYQKICDSFEAKRNLIRLALSEWMDQIRSCQMETPAKGRTIQNATSYRYIRQE